MLFLSFITIVDFSSYFLSFQIMSRNVLSVVSIIILEIKWELFNLRWSNSK